MERFLFQRFPELRSVPHIELAVGAPTPVEALAGLSETWGIPNLFIKREDLLSELYGGNKVRKLEFLLADTRSRGRRAVLTSGGFGSHHALATSLFASKLGMRATVVLVPQPNSEYVTGNSRACRSTGARVLRCRWPLTFPFVWGLAVARVLSAGEGWPYVIAPGGSSPLGVLGYVEAGLELAHQIRTGVCPAPDYVYIAVGSSGSIAGLGLGLGLGELDEATVRGIRLVGVRVVPRIATSVAYVHWMQRRTVRLLRRLGANLARNNPTVPVAMINDQLGRGYGHATDAGSRAAFAALDGDGLVVDPTYTAKTLAGLRAFATATPERRSRTHLYIHTLGARPEQTIGTCGDDAY